VYRDIYLENQRKRKEIDGVILGWEKEDHKKRKLRQIHNGSDSESWDDSESSVDENYKEITRAIRRKERSQGYLRIIRERENEENTDSSDDDPRMKFKKEKFGHNKFLAKLTFKNKKTI